MPFAGGGGRQAPPVSVSNNGRSAAATPFLFFTVLPVVGFARELSFSSAKDRPVTAAFSEGNSGEVAVRCGASNCFGLVSVWFSGRRGRWEGEGGRRFIFSSDEVGWLISNLFDGSYGQVRPQQYRLTISSCCFVNSALKTLGA